MKRQDYVFGSTTTNVEEQSASALNNGWAELSILYSRVLNGVCAALSQSTNYVSQEVANAIEGMGAELDPANNSQLLTVLQSLAIKESDFQTPVTPTNKGATMKEIEDLVTTSFVFKGYVSTTAPTQNLVVGNLWINSATMPTNFPIAAAAVKQWDGSEWVAYGSDYTPGNFDCFRNLNDNEGYYWFGGEWQVISTDLSTDYFTLNQVSGRWEIKSSVNLPGTPTCDTPSASNTRAIVNVDFVNNNTISSRNFTNCLTEIPQDIKLELNNGTLTLKAGSKVYVPNGFESNGVTQKFDEITIESDISHSMQTGSNWLFFYRYDGVFDKLPIAYCYSGISAPTSHQFMLWYDTITNLVKYTNDTGSTWTGGNSFPLCETSPTSINQTFNGFGYIDSIVFALPGVKGLIPNGRNEDGTLKNIEFESTEVTITNLIGDRYNLAMTTSGKIDQLAGFRYNPEHNYNYNHDRVSTTCNCGVCTLDNHRIKSFTPKTAFHAVDYNDLIDTSKNTIAIAAPAGIVAPFAGTTPPSGWLKCDGSAISRTKYAKLFAAIGGNYGWGDGSTTFNLPTQSVLPLGTSAKVAVYGTSKSIQVNDGTNNASLAAGMAISAGNRVGVGTKIGNLNKGDKGSGFAQLANDTTIGLKPSTAYGDSGIVGTADIANATGAKAIVCIKY